MQKNINIEKIIFKVVQLSSEQCILLIKNGFNVFTIENLKNIFMEHELYLIS